MKRSIAAVLAICAALVAAGPAALAADPIQLKFAFPPPPTSWINTFGIAGWSKAVADASGGTVDIKVFAGGAVANHRNVYDRVLNEVIDIGYGPFGEINDQFRRTEVSALPFEVQNAREASVALWRLVANGTIAEEYARIKPITVFTLAPSTLHTKAPVAKMDDLKGTKLAASSRFNSAYATLLGATPITVTNVESYAALDRGMVGGTFLSISGFMVFKLQEVVKHHLEVPFGASCAGFFMNKDIFARLPESARRAIETTSGEPLAEKLGSFADRQWVEDRAKLAAMPGQQFNRLDADEAARWKARIAPFVEEWVASTPDGAKVLAAFRAELAKIRSGT
jgi:TRAP-type C4-dicarboxylate transport system substrate-binding protein